MKIWILPVSLLFLGALILASLATGPAGLNLFVNGDSSLQFILWDLRFPRTMAAVLSGGLLSVVGGILQNLLKNPLAEPYTLGLSGAASFGSAAMVFLGLSPLAIFMPLGSLVMCLLVMLGFVSLMKNQSHAPRMLALLGVMISLFFASLVLLLTSLLPPERMQTLQYFFMGYLGTERDLWWPGLLALSGFVFVWGMARHQALDKLLLGDEVAQSLGVDVSSLRREIIILSSCIVAGCVSITGLIAFVGLIAPHLARTIMPNNKARFQIPLSFVCGSTLLLLADLAGRWISPNKDIPAGGFMALIGAPLFIYLAVRRLSYAKA